MRLWAPLLLFLGPALAQGVRTALTLEELEALLRSVPYRYERVEEEGEKFFRLRLAGLRAQLFPIDCREGRCTSLMLTASFALNDAVSLERINAWNRERRFSRAYLDGEGGPGAGGGPGPGGRGRGGGDRGLHQSL